MKGKDKNEKIKLERNILGVAELSRNGKAVDIDSALCYPFSVYPPSLCTGDGERRKTTKSALLPLLGDMTPEYVTDTTHCNVYMVDLAAFVICKVFQCKKVLDLPTLLWKNKPAQCKKLYVMEDSSQCAKGRPKNV